MAKRSEGVARESSLAAGWTVEADAEPDTAAIPRDGVPDSARAAASLPAGETPATDEAVGTAGAAVTAVPQQLSNSMMIMLGVFGGLYLAYLWIWYTWAKFMVTVTAAQLSFTTGTVGAILQTILYWLAPLAPALWLIATLRANRGGRSRGMALWLVIGAVVLLPLPYVLSGGEMTTGIFIGAGPLLGVL